MKVLYWSVNIVMLVMILAYGVYMTYLKWVMTGRELLEQTWWFSLPFVGIAALWYYWFLPKYWNK
jgi:hypothetical protein